MRGGHDRMTLDPCRGLDPHVAHVTRFLAEATTAPMAGYSVVEDGAWTHVAGDDDGALDPRALEPLWSSTLASDDIVVFDESARETHGEELESSSLPPLPGFYAGATMRDPEGQRVGCLWIADLEPRTGAERECSLLRSARMVLEDMALLRQQARVDVLTGLWNRRAMDDLIDREWRRAARLARPLSLLAIDVDHFKDFNDRFGHDAGDAALRSLAGLLQSTLQRPSDLLARVGGEEFLACLPDTDTDGARIAAEALRAAVDRRHFPEDGAPPRPALSISIGVATVFNPSLRPDALAGTLKAADRALYEAKHQGRNRVVISPSHRSLPVHWRFDSRL